MHGRKKLTQEQREQKAIRERGKIIEYRSLVEAFEKLPGATNQCDAAALPATISFKQWEAELRPLLDQILLWNPEYYSVWNYRRLMLKSIQRLVHACLMCDFDL